MEFPTRGKKRCQVSYLVTWQNWNTEIGYKYCIYVKLTGAENFIYVRPLFLGNGVKDHDVCNLVLNGSEKEKLCVGDILMEEERWEHTLIKQQIG